MNNWAKYAVGTALAAAAIGAGGAASADTVHAGNGRAAIDNARRPARAVPSASATERRLDASNDRTPRRAQSHPLISRMRADSEPAGQEAANGAAMPARVRAMNMRSRMRVEPGRAGQEAGNRAASPASVRTVTMRTPRMHLEREQAGRELANTDAAPESVRRMAMRMPRLTQARQPATVRYTETHRSDPATGVDLARGVRISRTDTRTVRSESVTDRAVDVDQQVKPASGRIATP